MPLFFDPRGHSTYGIGVCARCYRTMSLDDLYDDPNSPGLKVCRQDMDQFDPYRLPPRAPDQVTLPFTRPDVPIPASTDLPDEPGEPGWPPADSTTYPGM